MPAIGAAGAATFATAFDGDATVTYEWQTEIRTSESGLEQRVSARAVPPRQRYEFDALLTETQQRKILATLALHGHEGSLFYLGLSFESLPIKLATTTTIECFSLTLCDWAKEGQRIAVAAGAEMAETWIVSIAGNVITVNDDVTTVSSIQGAHVMPLMGVRLDPQQPLPRYQCNLSRWRLVAHAVRFRYGLDGTPGVGASVSTFDSLPVWDRIVPIRELRDESILTGVDLVDAGGAIGVLSHSTQPAWTRDVGIIGQEPADSQWFRKFLDTVCGCRKSWLLRTYRPDLVAVGNASSGTLTIDSSQQSYVDSWYPSLAHRRVAIVLVDGTVNYRNVIGVTDNGATEDLELSSALAGPIDHVELLETVRLDTDRVQVRWGRARVFESDFGALVVQQ